ncbi:Organic hydroperoxide reductase OsmC/OhrA [Vibrio crassostreae]|uniref:OsmC family protein n=1 Tax=Vibrio crassostreae TaxID=246167 RepID=UPI001B30CB21|nr:OsmC family protein [Vibrio crassostreae]CAK3029553.1 Organic hydroperoxide reductase OsmC/OhrA [Vibrio crassostreae]CAK3057104.1 Organic hydroperoxide reductase OsmC/OhrA [Vibrio crassostreae]CAK3514693.1 Organic hydroperoxide reductase OsmC/OhrA [Vibrio crassostreae]CAK3541304.1 Organic hydroperoxide reductase OsmC/OhrA [Vibrio crassostreae]CAK3550571.1 Organic hydroperoxide reductase OsmC/OhrA [Vibrio crassostreae]
MSEYGAVIRWQKAKEEVFSDNQYSRGHTWEFDGGVTVPASSSPHVVPLPLSVEANVDPEEAFIAALSSCHMLTFLGIAAKQKYVIESYVDDAIGVLEQDESGRSSVTSVTLRPKIVFIGSKVPTRAQLDKLHHLAHKNCFIANSVKTDIVVEAKV